MSRQSFSSTPGSATTLPQLADGLNANFTEIYGLAAGAIRGCRLSYDAAGTIGATSGALDINGTLYTNSAAVTLALSGLTADQWRYAYAKADGAGWALELSSTVPVWDATLGYQKKTGDATRRYLGPILAATATTMFRFDMVGERNQRYVRMIDDIYAGPSAGGGGPLGVLNGINSTFPTMTAVDASSGVPVGCDGFDLSWYVQDNLFNLTACNIRVSGSASANADQAEIQESPDVISNVSMTVRTSEQTFYWAGWATGFVDGDLNANAGVFGLHITI